MTQHLHLNEVAARHGEEGCATLPSSGLGQQGLACSVTNKEKSTACLFRGETRRGDDNRGKAQARAQMLLVLALYRSLLPTRAGRAHQQRSLGYLGTQLREARGVLQELHKLHDLSLGLVAPRHVRKGHLRPQRRRHSEVLGKSYGELG